MKMFIPNDVLRDWSV